MQTLTYGRWIVLEIGKKPRHMLCLCVCGTLREVATYALQSAHSRSCGCLSRELSASRKKKWPPHSQWLHQCWVRMRQRCNNPKDRSYPDYGGRGIRVCKRWESFGNFLADMGEPPAGGLSIERKDNDGDYKPSNCKWATRIEQSNNRRSNRKLTLNGATLTTAQWADKLGFNRQTLYDRLDWGWPVEKALTEPIQTKFRSKSQ